MLAESVAVGKQSVLQLHVIVFLAGRKKKSRRSKNAATTSTASSSSSISSDAQSQAAAAGLHDTKLVGLSTKLRTSTSDTGMLQCYLLMDHMAVHTSHFWSLVEYQLVSFSVVTSQINLCAPPICNILLNYDVLSHLCFR